MQARSVKIIIAVALIENAEQEFIREWDEMLFKEKSATNYKVPNAVKYKPEVRNYYYTMLMEKADMQPSWKMQTQNSTSFLKAKYCSSIQLRIKAWKIGENSESQSVP